MPTRMKCVLRQRQVQHNGDSLYDNIVPVFGQCPAVKLEWSRHLTANNNNLFRYQSFCATRHIPVVVCVFHRTVGTVMPTRVQNTAQVTNIFISIEFIYQRIFDCTRSTRRIRKNSVRVRKQNTIACKILLVVQKSTYLAK